MTITPISILFAILRMLNHTYEILWLRSLLTGEVIDTFRIFVVSGILILKALAACIPMNTKSINPRNIEDICFIILY